MSDCDSKAIISRQGSHGRSMTPCHHGTCTSMHFVYSRQLRRFLTQRWWLLDSIWLIMNW